MPEDFESSKLGTKEHWDDVYSRELANFEDDSGDEGEIWFGLESVEKMVDWAKANAPPASSPCILDIGCGNGTLSIALVQAGYDASRIQGIDYSPDSVRLARAVAAHRSAAGITFETNDFLKDDTTVLSGMGAETAAWDLLLDKGTFDAIALAPVGGGTATSPPPLEIYPTRVARLLKTGGHFLITSCNFTEDELKIKFTAPDVGLEYHSRIQHKTFTFGGKTGSTCSSVAFIKK